MVPSRGRAVAKDRLGRRRRSSKSHAGVVKLAQVTPRPLGLERLSGKVGPEIGQADKLEEPADDLGLAGLGGFRLVDFALELRVGLNKLLDGSAQRCEGGEGGACGGESGKGAAPLAWTAARARVE